MIASLHYGLTRHVSYLSHDERAGAFKWLKASTSLSMLVPVFIKVSVCVSILRIIKTVERIASRILWLLIGVLMIDGLVTFLLHITACTPLEKLWDPGKPGRCLDIRTLTWITIAYGGM